MNEADVNIGGGSNVTFKDTVTVTTNGLDISEGSTVEFQAAVTANGIDIEDIDEATFGSTVNTGYLLVNKIDTSETRGKTTFNGAVTVTGTDGYMTFDGKRYATGFAMLNSENIFKSAVTITSSTDTASAVFASSTTTFADELKVGTNGNGSVFIGYSEDVRHSTSGLMPDRYNQATKVILDGTNAKITAANVNVFQKGTLQFDSAGIIDGNLNVLSGGAVTSGTGMVKITDELSINGNSTANFGGDLNVTNGIEVMDGAVQTVFDGNVTASSFAIDTVTGAGSSTNTFNGTFTLNGQDPDIQGRNVSLVVIDGTNTFEGAVTTGNKDAIFAKSESTFNTSLNAGSGVVDIGYSDDIKGAESEPGKGTGFYNQNATVILGDSASITAATVNVFEKGILKMGGNASVTGNLNFKAGSTFAIDAANTLTVSGATDIEDGAMANVQNASGADSIGNIVLNSTGGFTGGDFTNTGLYAVAKDGNNLKITGMNKVEDVLSNAGIVTGNLASAAGMVTSILSGGATATQALKDNLSDAINKITADIKFTSNPELAKAATAQLFGEHGLAGISASQTTAQNFSGSVGNHQVQLRDAAFASVSAGSSSALASFVSASSGFNPNRIWGGGFGAWTDQNDRNNMTGYEYRSGGFILGYDRKIGESLIVGVSGAYSTGEIENNDGYTTTDVDTFNVGLYASYNHASGFFADVNAGLGFAWNDTETQDIINGGRKTGDYENTSFQLGGTVGYAFTLPQEFRFIPSVGVQYTHVSQDAWNEEVNAANQIANAFDESNQNYVSIPVQVRVNKTFNLGNGASITPEVRGAWIYEAKDPQARVRMGYVGSNASTTLYGIDTGRSRGLIGAGVKAKFNNCVDAFVDYNYEFRSGYSNHNVMAGLGLSF